MTKEKIAKCLEKCRYKCWPLEKNKNIWGYWEYKTGRGTGRP